METLGTIVMFVSAVVVGLFVRVTLVPLALAVLLAVPVLVISTGVWASGALWRRLASVTDANGLLWKRGLAACHRASGP